MEDKKAWTRQEIFDKVASHLLRQNAKSVVTAGAIGCSYRGIEGRKCAIGILIDDDEYEPEMEGRSVGKLLDFPQCSWMWQHQGFLRELQNIHDTFPPEEWEDNLIRFSENHNLTFNKPNA